MAELHQTASNATSGGHARLEKALDRLKRGIIHGGQDATKKQITNALLIGIPAIGTAYSLFYFSQHKLLPFSLFQFFLWYVISGVGIGVGFHRLFVHKSFQSSNSVRFLFGLAGSLAFQGSVIRWIADHRRHHRFADDVPDTHTPHRFPILIRYWGRLKNLSYAHVGWMFDETTTDPKIFAPDLLRDPVSLWLDRWYVPITGLSLGLPYLIGYMAGGRRRSVPIPTIGRFRAHSSAAECYLGRQFHRTHMGS